jgi:hypothetical protein
MTHRHIAANGKYSQEFDFLVDKFYFGLSVKLRLLVFSSPCNPFCII